MTQEQKTPAEFYLCIPLNKLPTRTQVETLNIVNGRLVSDLAKRFGFDGASVVRCPIVPVAEMKNLSAAGILRGQNGGLSLELPQER